MSKVLVIGHAPLPWEDLERSYGPGTRTWQFVEPMLADGHDVTLLASRIPFVYSDETAPVVRSEERGCVLYRVSRQELESGVLAGKLVRELNPDCVVGATAFPSLVAVKCAGELPVWADIFGSLLAEAQARAAVYRDNSLLEYHAKTYPLVIERADRFSTVSRRQKYELVGQLGMSGRLTAETFGYDFVCPVPCGVEEPGFPPTSRYPEETGTDDFILLFSGGFNTWTDVPTLFRGVEMAISRAPGIHFVSTGGEIRGHDERTYSEFEAMVDASRYRDRFHLLGWVKKSEAISYYGTASAGISIDGGHYEAMLGSRNRILSWAMAGLPAISTNLCELTGELESEGLLFPIPVGDAGALAEVLVELEGDRVRLKEVGGRLKEFVLERYLFDQTTRELREWVTSPRHAPDFDARRAVSSAGL